MDRTQEISQNIVVYTKRCCRTSYGIICRQLYDPIKHQGEDVVIDPRDKQKWAERQIHWFIEQVSQAESGAFSRLFLFLFSQSIRAM
jgi:hypothetical protein